MDQKLIREKLSEGFLQVRVIIEVAGKPKKHVADTLKEQVNKIQSSKKIFVINTVIEKPEEQENYFIGFAELEMLFKNPNTLISFCFDFMPSSIEIMEPEHLKLSSQRLSGFLNDLQARLHGLNTGIIQLREQNTFYVKNTAVLLRNFIVVLLKLRSMTPKQMKPYLGIREEDILKVLGVLEKEKKVKKEGEVYSLNG